MLKKILIPVVSLGLFFSPIIGSAASAQDLQEFERNVPTTQMAALSYNVIAGVPDIYWYKGCTTTAFGMIVRYWDNNGLPFLSTNGESDYQLIDRIANNYFHPNPNDDYGVPMLRLPQYIQAFFNDTVYGYSTKIGDINSLYETDKWNKIVQEIDAGRPLMLNLNSYNHPGVPPGIGHAVVVVGYNTSSKQLIIHNTYSEGNVTWNYDKSAIYSLLTINPRGN